MKKQIFSLLFIFLLSLNPSIAKGEVVKVVVTWSPGFCNPDCANLLKERLQKMTQVQEVNVDANSGVANIKWNPTSSFSYQPIKQNMQMTGIGVNDISISVRGKIVEDGQNAILISDKDKTRFTLVSPLMGDPRKYTTSPNPFFRSLTPELKENLLQEAKQGKIFLVDGSLYQPARSPPLQLIVKRYRIEKVKE